jgi:hypothetical protein
MEKRHLYFCQVELFNGMLQGCLGGAGQHHQMTGLGGPGEMPAGFQAGMSHLNHLLCQRNIGAHQHIGPDEG